VNVKKAGGTVLILMERMLLIKNISRIQIDTKKMLLSNHLVVEKDFIIAMTMIESEIDSYY
jgi:hypothetical protein